MGITAQEPGRRKCGGSVVLIKTGRTMDNIKNRMDALSWPSVSGGMDARGYALIPGILSPDECDTIVRGYEEAALYRKTISMERYRFGAGEYKYFAYPLPDMLQGMRENIYPR